MRALLVPCALVALFAGPLSAQARFIKVDVVNKSNLGGNKAEGAPTEVHMRVPINLAKGFLAMAEGGKVKVNGKSRRDLKVDQLVALLESAKSGDLLMELTTDKGDLVKIAIE